jgi:hypothetical protein
MKGETPIRPGEMEDWVRPRAHGTVRSFSDLSNFMIGHFYRYMGLVRIAFIALKIEYNGLILHL